MKRANKRKRIAAGLMLFIHHVLAAIVWAYYTKGDETAAYFIIGQCLVMELYSMIAYAEVVD